MPSNLAFDFSALELDDEVNDGDIELAVIELMSCAWGNLIISSTSGSAEVRGVSLFDFSIRMLRAFISFDLLDSIKSREILIMETSCSIFISRPSSVYSISFSNIPIFSSPMLVTRDELRAAVANFYKQVYHIVATQHPIIHEHPALSLAFISPEA